MCREIMWVDSKNPKNMIKSNHIVEHSCKWTTRRKDKISCDTCNVVTIADNHTQATVAALTRGGTLHKRLRGNPHCNGYR